MNGATGLEPGTVGSAIDVAARRLADAGIPAARREARLLVAAASGVAPEAILAHPERAIDAATATRAAALVDRRAAREPLAKIVGRREFWTLSLLTTADTLDPRPESEIVVEAALAATAHATGGLRVLDLGTGTGCLLLAVLAERPAAVGIGVDISPAAIRVAAENARRHRLDSRARFVVADWGRGLAGRFDLVLANPPYVAEDEFPALDPEVTRYEPRMALDGGPDGLDAYRALLPGMRNLLAPGGRLLLEIGAGQARAVARLLAANGLVRVAACADLAGRTRCLVARPAADSAADGPVAGDAKSGGAGGRILL